MDENRIERTSRRSGYVHARTIQLGVTDNIDKHRRIAELTVPLFLFVAAAVAGLTAFLHVLFAAS